MRPWYLAIVVLCLGLAAPPAWGQAEEKAAAAESSEAPPGSPRASVAAFLALCRQGRYQDAASYLDLPDEKDGAEAARQLEAVLDRYLWGAELALSAAATGDTSDGLPYQSERVGEITGADGISRPLLLTRRSDGADGRWVFSKRTLSQLGGWYETLTDRGLRERLPGVLLGHGPRGLYWWQWLALPLLVGGALLLGALLAALSRWVLRRILPSAFSRAMTLGLRGPIILGWALLGLWFSAPLLGGYPFAERFLGQLVGAGLFAVFFWSLWRAVGVLGQRVTPPASAPTDGVSALLPLGLRAARVVIMAVAAISVLSALGYPVGSFLAGLGLGGLALALAFQKTGENLFGSLALGIDKPFEVGDLVRVEDTVLGYVEAVGLRSTRVRTYDRTLVSFPNGKLAEMRIESLSARDRMRLSTILGIAYGATEAQVRAALEGLRALLMAHPKIYKDDVMVRLIGFGEYSIRVEIMCWFETRVFDEFLAIREEVTLGMMGVLEQAGVRLAVPEQAVRLLRG